ncbi:GTP-binding protein [Cellvibrio mixtus]|jgi:hypothetical protein|uniref:GTP-binding protein n=1 Tax=Cellvibrio mixtus TaxID=39650 RepID=UPI001FD4DE05|nr:GTP-binding protein [Cellvibrio mixtus]
MFQPQIQFDFNQLFGWMTGLDLVRAKAVMNTDQGIYMFNAEQGVLSVKPLAVDAELDLLDSRIELINDQPLAADELEQQLLQWRRGES